MFDPGCDLMIQYHTGDILVMLRRFIRKANCHHEHNYDSDTEQDQTPHSRRQK